MQGVEFVGQSRAHRRLVETLDKVARTDVEVLITGPSGVGKELYARYLHQRSERFAAPFVAVNCGGLSAELLENELFGHVAGAFTGARDQREGLVAAAQGGTLFFDEVDTLPPISQTKLLRSFKKRVSTVGRAPAAARADVRFVAATNVSSRGGERGVSAGSLLPLRVIPSVPPSGRAPRTSLR